MVWPSYTVKLRVNDKGVVQGLMFSMPNEFILVKCKVISMPRKSNREPKFVIEKTLGYSNLAWVISNVVAIILRISSTVCDATINSQSDVWLCDMPYVNIWSR